MNTGSIILVEVRAEGTGTRITRKGKRRTTQPTGANPMTTACYRGINYNVEDRQLNDLVQIQRQIEKVRARKEAEKANIRLSHKS